MRSIRRRTAIVVAALGATTALAAPAAAQFLLPTATAGHTSPTTIRVATDGYDRLQFEMDQIGDHVDIKPNQKNQRITAGRGCTALPVTPVPNQGVRCDASELTALNIDLGPGSDSFFHSIGSQAFNEIDDTVDAGPGFDFITTRGGDDVVSGGSEADRLVTGAGADRVTGDGGADTIDAGPGDDIVNAFDGPGTPGDTVTCGTGLDGVVADQSDTVAADCENVLRLF